MNVEPGGRGKAKGKGAGAVRPASGKFDGRVQFTPWEKPPQTCPSTPSAIVVMNYSRNGARTALSACSFEVVRADKAVRAPRSGSWKASTIPESRMAAMNRGVAVVARASRPCVSIRTGETPVPLPGSWKGVRWIKLVEGIRVKGGGNAEHRTLNIQH